MDDSTDHSPRLPGQRQGQPAAARTDPTPQKTPSRPSRRTALRAWWKQAWQYGGVLHERWEDLRQGPELGWHQMANWVKALFALAGFSVTVLLLDAAAGIIFDTVHRLLSAAPRMQVGTDTSTGVWAVIDQPVRTYLAQHSTGLAISASTTYTLWQFTGLAALVLGFLTRNNGVRLTWAAWGAASTWMVWTATPETGRTVAAGITVLTWAAASTFALRGLSLRRISYVHTPSPRIDIRPEIHVPAPATPAATGAAGADNVHPLR